MYIIDVTSDIYGNGITWLNLDDKIPVFVRDITEANNNLNVWSNTIDNSIRISGMPANVTHKVELYFIKR